MLVVANGAGSTFRHAACAHWSAAPAASNHAAAPPISVMNSRRLMSNMGACSPALSNAGHLPRP